MAPKTYPKETWARIRAGYESGAYNSMRELHKHYEKELEDCPSIDAFRRRSIREKWEKGKNAGDIQKREQEKIVDIFARLGMGAEERIQAVIDGVSAGKDAYEKLAAYFSDGGSPLAQEFGQLLKGYFRDLSVSRGFVDIMFKLTGEYAPTQSQFTGKGGKPLIPKRMTDDMNDQEIAMAIASMVKNAKNSK